MPVHLDALLVQDARAVVPPSADFSRLPHVRQGHDVNGDVPWLGEAIASRPFAEASLSLPPGVHLHWALPDALCRTSRAEGERGPSKLLFPAVPDRWLVTRRWTADGAEHVLQWVVESNYLHPADATPEPRPVAYPQPADLTQVPAGEPPFRYLGRAVPRAQWPAAPRAGESRLAEPLTALGYGEPSFAAFYPNSHSVFGFHDADVTLPLPASLSYQVLGWYADPAQDYLRQLAARGSASPEHSAALEALGWTADGAPSAAGPPRMVCQARLTFPSTRPDTALKHAPVAITFGNTIPEALSAHLAAVAEEADEGVKSQIEDQLEAILSSAQLDQRRTDIGFKFEEARHAKGFMSAPPDHLWTVRPKSNDPTEEAPLPDWPDVAQLLDELNALQRAYNQAWDEIRQRRRQLVADWHKYMSCASPPGGDATQVMDADEIRGFIERVCLPALEGCLADAGELSGDGAEVVVVASSPAGSLARRVFDTAARTARALDAHFDTPTVSPRPPGSPTSRQAKPTRFVLQRFVAPRYFQPTEPVLLLTGEAMKTRHRYDRGEGPAGTGGLLRCRWLACPKGPAAALDAIAAELTRAQAWDTQAWSPPWHPFSMEWEVELRPWSRFTAGRLDSTTYDADFVTRNFTLLRADVDLTPRADHPALAREGHLYRGASLLTPHGVDPYLAALRAEWTRGNLPTLDGGDEDHFGLSGLITDGTSQPDWYRTRLSAMERALQNLPAMAQSLSGINEALLMNRAVLQLPVAHPLGFPDEVALAARVRAAVGDRGHRSPQPLLGFLPVRAGELRLRRLRVVDTFGQVLDVDCGAAKVRSARTLPLRGGAAVMLPPRLAQPARLHFRWHAAERPSSETHAHPETSPIAGWVTTNHADQSVFVHAADGLALGYLEVEGARVRWRSAPGRQPPITQLDVGIDSAQLQQLVRFLLAGTPAYFETFLHELEMAQELIEPEDAGDALLLGRPLALVRACLQLQLQGPPAIDQSWHALATDLMGAPRTTDRFERVRFPIRLGDQRQLGDGVTVYFPEDPNGRYDSYVIPDYRDPVDPDVAPEDRKCDFLYQSPDGRPLMVTMLIDPRAKVHATTGVLPTKIIDIPPHHYRDALRRIETSFLAAPILVERDAAEIDVPLAERPERTWVFVGKRGDAFEPARPVRPAPLHVPLAAPVGIREGWLRLTRDPPAAGGDTDE